MSLSLVQLEALSLVVAHGSFTRAAEELGVTQPAVTQHVHALERHFKLRLIEVVGRRAQPTDAGRFLAAYAADLLGGVAALERDMREFAAARTGNLALGATLTIGSYVLPDLLARYTLVHPGVQVQVTIANTRDIVRRLHAGEVGLALIEGPVEDPDLDLTPFQDDRLVLVLPLGHRLAGCPAVAARELAGEPFIAREPGSGTRALVETALARAGVVLRPALEWPSGEGVARAVEAGLGVAILSLLVVERAASEGRVAIAALDGVDLRRTFRLATVCGRVLSPATQSFARLIAADYADRDVR